MVRGLVISWSKPEKVIERNVSRFAYKSIRLHRGRFAYTTKSFRLHGLSRFAYIKVVSRTLISRNVL